MNLSTKILLFLGGCLVFGILCFIVVKQIELAKQQAAIESNVVAQKDLANDITRSMNTYATKDDLDKFAKQSNVNLSTIQSDLDKLNASVVAINKVSTQSNGYTGSFTGVKGNHNTGNNTTPTCKDGSVCANADPFGYMKDQQVLALNEKFANVDVPFGTVGFSAWKDKPFDLNVYTRNYNTVNVLGQDQNGRHYVYSKVSIDVNGKSYDLKIAKAETVEEYPSDSFSFFNPQLFMSASGSVNLSQAPIRGEFTPAVVVGIMSYGKTKTNPVLSIAQIGLGYGVDSQRPSVVFNPISVNIGGVVPGGIVRNTYIGPTFSMNTAGSVFIGGGLSVGF